MSLSNTIMVFNVASQEPDGTGRRLSGNGVISARFTEGDVMAGFLNYYLLRAVMADSTEVAHVVRVTEVVVFEEFRGEGVASTMYNELRESQPQFLIAADNHLTEDGRRVATHYREKYPERHVGRLDLGMTLHPTSDARDPIYRDTYFASVDSAASAGDADAGLPGPTAD